MGVLFGEGYAFEVLRSLSQPGQFAYKETVDIAGPKGLLKGVRVLGPARPRTQIEVSVTDTFALGVPAMVRMSGDVEGSAGCRIIGPRGEADLKEGLMVSKRHLHLSAAQAERYGLSDGDMACVKIGGERAMTLGGIIVRAGDGHEMEIHIDTDEANAALIKNGAYAELVGP